MIAIELPRPIEEKFLSIVREGYDGNLQEAMIALFQLHEKCASKFVANAYKLCQSSSVEV